MTRLVSPCVLLAAALALPAAAPPKPAEDALLTWARKMQARHAYGMYMGGKKAGYILEECKLGTLDGRDVLTVSNRQYTVTLYDGEKSVKDESTAFHYELTGDGLLLAAKQTRKEDGKSVTHELARAGTGARITTRQGGRTLTRDIAMPKDNLAIARALEDWLTGPRKAGDRFTKYSLSWEGSEVDQKEVYVYAAKKTATVEGVKRPAYAVVVDIDGGKLVADVFPDGRPIHGVLGGLLTLKLEKQSEAIKVEGAPADLMEASCVTIDMDLGRAREVDELKLELSGLDDFAIPASHRQVTRKENDRVLLTLKRDFKLGAATPLTQADVREHTRPTPRLQSDHKAVAALAKKVVGGEADVLKKARLLNRWVYANLRKSYSDNADTALEVLDRKAGDCTEHALLLVTLARAVGVPAREVGGLAYIKQNDKPMMGWHAWAEVHDGHQWVSVDPTWDQVYVDATHLKMSEGEKDLAWANVAGKLKIKALEMTRRQR